MRNGVLFPALLALGVKFNTVDYSACSTAILSASAGSGECVLCSSVYGIARCPDGVRRHKPRLSNRIRDCP
ncbi:hypothetical protein IJI17_03330 [Candidatus Saccharibacteria bacterium]|nr:hypothetical protein [Candidatus Saccharibacteria bacterium]